MPRSGCSALHEVNPNFFKKKLKYLGNKESLTKVIHVLNGLLKPIFGSILPHLRRHNCQSWLV